LSSTTKTAGVVLQPKERDVMRLLTQIHTIRKDKDTKRKAKQVEKRQERAKSQAKEDAITQDKKKEKRKEYFALNDPSKKRPAGQHPKAMSKRVKT
jgi:ribosome biogenesis protein BMS1